MPRSEPALAPDQRERLVRFFEAHAEPAEPSEAFVREGLAFLDSAVFQRDGLAPNANPNADLGQVFDVVATVAWSNLASAFTLWCHRMVLEYLWPADSGSPLRQLFEQVRRTRLLGCTAMAASFAHYVSGAPLSVHARKLGSDIILNGRVSWASNLFPPRFAMVTAAADSETGRASIVALPGDVSGLSIEPYPRLLALQATGSSSIVLDEVKAPSGWVLQEEFGDFVGRVRPTFLLLQSALGWGLARRALAEARAGIRGVNEVLRPDLEQLEAASGRLETALRSASSGRGQGVAMGELVRLRLEGAQLATSAVALEAKVAGGRGYVNTTATARRLREGAFFPIQAPTEGQLRWELLHST